MARARGAKPVEIPFPHKLVLNQWVLIQFGVKQFEDLAEPLRHEALEGLDEHNVCRFHHRLTSELFNNTRMSTEALLRYDQNIVGHTLRINDRRRAHGEDPIAWKYFQYLSLLFTEIYLERIFDDPAGLLGELNGVIATFNEGKDESQRIETFDVKADAWTQLNKLSFWMATGSGKTFLMHVHMRQYLHYLERSGRRRELNRILLLTPNEGLSQQHLREFTTAGIPAELFVKDGGGLFAGTRVEILEVTRLRDEMGEKTIAVEAFEGNNLVLVDEGHRGTSGGGDGAWMRFRNALCAKGFSFEYSATFGQAVKGKAGLTDLYAKNILCDYSYRYFHRDGFGKDYQILNLDETTQRDHRELYLVACLLAFFQQLRLFRDQEAELAPFQIEKPLWIFVGSSVTAYSAHEASDIVEILQFVARYVKDRSGSVGRIERVLNHGLVTDDGSNLFAGRFAYLHMCGLNAAQVFDESLALLFNAPTGGQLHIENLKGVSGEIALRIGADSDPFGVINVGDDVKLVKLCREHGLSTADREFSGSLFHEINDPQSPVNVLIGSKKFTEGWSSWRVSTMGLMNVGKSEGAQIIQLFGRGVRLKGFETSLKRSGRVRLPEHVARPKFIGVLETLGIFGIHADYMAQFREFLKDERLPVTTEQESILLPIIKNLGTQPLKMIRLKRTIRVDGTDWNTDKIDAFRRIGPVPTVRRPDRAADPTTEYLEANKVVLDWYPKIRSMESDGVPGSQSEAEKHQARLTREHLAFLDLDALYFELERFKAERGWFNLNLPRETLGDLLADHSWYELFIPSDEMQIGSFAHVRRWQDIALALLKKYVDRYYAFRRREWEMRHLEYRVLDGDDPNFIGVRETPSEGYYEVLVDQSRQDIVAKLNELRAAIVSGQMKSFDFQGIKAIWFGRHVYQPLLYLDSKVVEISPAPLNKGERRFVEDLSAFHSTHTSYFATRELYLLRNQSRGKGIGFFEAGNFHPDFILWLLVDGKQHVIFVDPKGLRQIGKTDPKIRFHKTIKEIEERLGDTSVRLESFIVATTDGRALERLWDTTKSTLKDSHIVFQEDRESYVRDILTTVSPD